MALLSIIMHKTSEHNRMPYSLTNNPVQSITIGMIDWVKVLCLTRHKVGCLEFNGAFITI